MCLNQFSAIRGLKYIAIILFSFFWIFYVIPVTLLKFPYVQDRISKIATTELSNRLGVPVKIEHIKFEWFNRLALENVYLEDQSGGVLLEANHISAGFEIPPLFKRKLVFNTVRLFGLSANINRNTSADPLNLQFLIDAFSSRDTTKQNPHIDLRFNSILIRKGSVKYNILSESRTPGKFNSKHIEVKDLSANIVVRALNKDSLNAQIRKMSFYETSGFSLDRLVLDVVGNRDSISLKELQVRLPQTNFRVEEANIDLKEIKSLEELINNAPLKLKIAQSEICLSDIQAFVPAFSNFRETIDILAEADGYINNINLRQLTLDYNRRMQFVGNMELRGIFGPTETYLFGQVRRMQITTEGIKGIVNNFNEQPVRLPDEVSRLGTLRFNGEISGFLNNLVAFGKFSSDIGTIETDVNFGSDKENNIGTFLKGHIASPDLDLNLLFGAGNPYGDSHFNIALDAVRPVNGKFAGKINAEVLAFDYKGYKYENLLFTGNFKENGFDGTVRIDDENGQLTAQGEFMNMGANSIFNFTADVRNFHPDKLNLTDKYEEPDISFSINADFTGNNIDNLNGKILLDSFSFRTASEQFLLEKLQIMASGESANRRLSISSDILNGEVVGAYSFTTLVPSFMNTIDGYFPALVKEINYNNRQVRENNFSLMLTIENTEVISSILKLPLTIINQARITGLYNNQYNKFRIEAYLPKFNVGSSMFESGYLTCDNQSDELGMQFRVINYNKNGIRNSLDIKADAKENNINSIIAWANNKEESYRANFRTSTLFTEEKNESGRPSLRTEISINPDYLVVNDSAWHIKPSRVIIEEGRISVDNFFISHDDEYLKLDGTVSKDPSDMLLLDLQEIELSYIFNTVNIPVLQFGGKATGTININDLYNNPMINTDLEVQNFSFNQVELGRLNLFSEWDDVQQGILMLGSIYKNDSTWTDVNGYIYPVGEHSGLSLYFDANDIDLSFLAPYLDNVTSHIEGRGFGWARLFGSFKDVTVEGDAYVQDGKIGVDFLNTYYTFSDSLHLTPNSIQANKLTIYDRKGSKGVVDLNVGHNFFRDFKFAVNIQAENMLVYDKTEYQEPMIFGTVYGSGTTVITGNEQLVNFDINMRSAPNTSVTFNFMNSSTATEYDFISFIDRAALARDTLTNDSVKSTTTFADMDTEIRMNFLVDITPDAQIELIMDPTAGDKIKGNCTGSMQVQYGTKSDLRMYGTVDIIEGSYNFSLQQLIHKDFKIREGSTVEFRGDPFEAVMNINAIYNLTANIGDLDQSFIMETPRMNIPVNCVLLINGLLRNSTVSFDLELPGSNAELERQVRSLIETEDLMTTQVIYLLVLNKFYTSDTYVGYSRNEFGAIASSALSSQLSSILNSFTDKVQIGTNIRSNSQDGLSDTEVEMLLSSQLLDNRLLFNGNFGVRRNPVLGQESTFVGEFDLEYKLTPSGEIRLKAYNHANDMYRYLKSLTTQGIGIMYRIDFSNFSDIFRRKQLPLLPPASNNGSTPMVALPAEETVAE